MSYDREVKQMNPIKAWFINWVSDWFGLFDIVVGIMTFTFYYPETQKWWFDKSFKL